MYQMMCNINMSNADVFKFQDPHQQLDSKRSHINIFNYQMEKEVTSAFILPLQFLGSQTAYLQFDSPPPILKYHQSNNLKPPLTTIHNHQTRITTNPQSNTTTKLQIQYYQTHIHPHKHTNKPISIITAQGNYFSNDYDLTTSLHKANPKSISSSRSHLISLPMPIIATVLG